MAARGAHQAPAAFTTTGADRWVPSARVTPVIAEPVLVSADRFGRQVLDAERRRLPPYPCSTAAGVDRAIQGPSVPPT